MAVKTSTGYEALILGPNAFDTIFRDGVIEVRSETQPVSADEAPIGILLATITVNGGPWAAGSPANGLRFSRGGRFASKNLSQRWQLKGVATGIAGWMRLLPNQHDPGGVSAVHPRIDGAAGLIDTLGDIQLYLPTLSITPSTTIELPNWWFAKPL